MRIKQVHIQTLFDLQIEKYFSDIPSTYKIHLWIFATEPEAETVNTKTFLRINHELVHKESFYWKKVVLGICHLTFKSGKEVILLQSLFMHFL